MLGATGQIGRAAVRALAADGWEVTAVFPKMVRGYGETLFDYAAEDAWLNRHARDA